MAVVKADGYGHGAETVARAALSGGASGGKGSGAGGGGFMMLYCPKSTRFKVMEKLNKMGGEFRKYSFVESGLVSWKI